MFRIISAICLLFFYAPSATAQHIGDCEGSLVGHVLSDVSEDAFVDYANGTIRVADIYMDGNLASNVVVVVLHPRLSDLQGAGFFQACTVIYSTRTRSPYFGQVFLRRAVSRYDATKGLTLTVPVRYDYFDQASEDGTLTILIDQSSGAVTPEEK